MLINGDKLVVKKKVTGFLDVGDIAEVINVDDDGLVYFAFGEDFLSKGLMTPSECEEHFEKIDIDFEAPVIKEERIDALLDEAKFETYTLFDKCTVVCCLLPNGFVITEAYDFLTPAHYDENIGFDICFNKIKAKLFELESYRIKEELYEESFFYDEEDEFDECLDTDLDCDDCEDCNCRFNSNNKR